MAMDVWSRDEQVLVQRNTGWIRYFVIGLGSAAVLAIALSIFISVTPSPSEQKIQLSDALLSALEEVVQARSPALEVDGRQKLLAQQQLAALAVRERLGPMAQQEQALFALLNGRLNTAQSTLQIKTTEDIEIAVSIARLRLDYSLAVQLLERVIQHKPDRAGLMQPLLAEILAEQGLVGGLVSPLREAVALYQNEILPNAKDERALALFYNNMGIALQALARLTQDNVLLEDAAIAFADSLRIMPQESKPEDITAAQTNLAAVLFDLSVIEPSLPLLQSAEAALRAAMERATNETQALYQRQLVAVLLLQADENGHALRLNEVGPLIEAAYAPGTPHSRAASRASVYREYGDALASLGETRADSALLLRAVTAYDNALELTDERNAPLDWAALQANLGTVHAGLAGMGYNAKSFDEAREAYQEALTVFANQNASLDWAMTQNNLALTLESEAARSNDANLLNEALRRYVAALDTFTGANNELAIQVRENLSIAENRAVEMQLLMSNSN
jgi:hypothetical protein